MYPLNVMLVGCNERVLADVRMELENQSAHVEAEFTNVDSVIDGVYWSPDEKRLFILHLRSPEDLPELRHLRGSFVGQPIVALVEARNDSALLTGANRAGATQVVSLPLQAEDFREALNCIRLQFTHPTGETKVIAVSGVTGGCGATTVAINLAAEIAHLQNVHAILMELSLRRGMLATYLDVEPRFTTHDLLSAAERLDIHLVQQALTRIADNFDILAAPHRSIASHQVAAQDVMRIIDKVKRLASVILLDVPCTYDDFFFETLATADQVVLVAEQKVPSIRSLKLLHDTLRREDANRTYHLVINRYGPKLPGFTVTELEKLLQGPSLLTISNDYAAVMSSVNHGRTLRQEAPQCRARAGGCVAGNGECAVDAACDDDSPIILKSHAFREILAWHGLVDFSPKAERGVEAAIALIAR